MAYAFGEFFQTSGSGTALVTRVGAGEAGHLVDVAGGKGDGLGAYLEAEASALAGPVEDLESLLERELDLREEAVLPRPLQPSPPPIFPIEPHPDGPLTPL